MSIRWRLLVLGIQVVVLTIATKLVTDHFVVEEPWFIAGLFCVIVNPQLIEHPYVRQTHVIANAVLFLFLYWLGHNSATQIGWNIAAVFFGIAALLAIFGVLVVETAHARVAGLARASRQISQKASGDVVFSIVFFLDLPNHYAIDSPRFWALAFVWLVLLLLGHTDWHRLWVSISVRDPACLVESLTGPSVLTVTGSDLPEQGTWVQLRSTSASATGIVLRRILRKDGAWGQIHVNNMQACRQFLADVALDIDEDPNVEKAIVGSVDEGSTDTKLRFITTKALEVGNVVVVPIVGSDDKIIYQLTNGVIEHTDVKGGAHLFVRAIATQIGRFLLEQQTFRRYLWVPSPGGPVLSSAHNLPAAPAAAPNAQWERLGNVIGTDLPVYLDLATMSEGHLAILGMTKMGKTTLAARLAGRLAAMRAVVILDLTGEYISKRGLPAYTGQGQLKAPGISVWELEPGAVPANKLLIFLKKILTDLAIPEYKAGEPFPRTLIIDEAHQFIPEPAGIGFNAPGRDSSYEIGLLMMQVRKYGISVVLISQRTAVVAKSALSQCENLIAFRSVDQTGLDYLEAVAGEDVRHLLPRLKQRQALVFGPSISSDSPVAVDVA